MNYTKETLLLLVEQFDNKAELEDFLYYYEDEDEITLEDIEQYKRDLAYWHSERIAELEEEQDRNGFYHEQDIIAMYRRER